MACSSCKQQNEATGILPIRNTRRRKEERKWEGTEIHYSYYRNTENFILPNSQAVPARPSGTIRLMAR